MVDAGNLFVYSREFPPHQKDKPELIKKAVARAELLAEVYGRLGAHGMAVGGSDLALGVDTLKTIGQKYRLPYLSANLLDAGGKRVFPASRVVRVGGIPFGLFGLSAKHPRWQDVDQGGKIRFGDPLEATRAEVKALRAQGARIVVLLAAIGHPEASRIAREVPGIDFVFVSGTGRHMPNPERQGSAFLTETTREGKYIGHLTLYIREGKTQFEDFSERFSMVEQIKGMQKSLDSMQKNVPPDVADARRQWMATRVEQIQKGLNNAKRQLYISNQRSPKESFLVSLMTPCALTLPEDQAVADLISTRAKAAGLQRPPGSH